MQCGLYGAVLCRQPEVAEHMFQDDPGLGLGFRVFGCRVLGL